MSRLRFLVVVVLASCAVFTVANVCARAADADEEAEKIAEIRKQIEEKKLELNGTSWDVQVSSQSGKGALVGPDQLIFQDGKFKSENAEKKGYAPTNYTLTVQEDGSTVWETMQTSEKEGIAFWRGEWRDEVMSGVISRQLEEGNEDYYFSSSAMQRISPTGSEAGEGEGEIEIEEMPTEPNPALVSSIPAERTEEKPKKSSWLF